MIKNIIFDLGGVFIKIQYQKTSQAFKDLGITNFDDFFKQDFCNDLFEQLEVGKVNDIEFYTQFRALTKTNLTNHQIKDAWNAMLGSFWQDRLDWLEGISKRFNIFLFSNTNAIHYNAFMQQYHDSIALKTSEGNINRRVDELEEETELEFPELRFEELRFED
jgi:putative hydrolase of the HAD superfamily